jgi:hypothetical protein
METTLTIMDTNEANNNQETFDPQVRDDKYYSSNPYQHGSSDYGKQSEGVGTGEMVVSSAERGDVAYDLSEDREDNRGNFENEARPDSHGSNQEWHVDPNVIAENRQDAANAPDSVESGLPSSVEGLPDNPSDEALFVRQGATYLEESDKPSESYDPHHMGYGNGDDEKKDKS